MPPADVTAAFPTFLQGCRAKVAVDKQGCPSRTCVWLAGHCPLGTRQRGPSLGSGKGRGGGQRRDAKILAARGEGARTWSRH